MDQFKRSQIEEAFERLTGRNPKLPGTLRRLLDADRRMSMEGRNAVRPFAFFDVSPTGRGNEVWYTLFNAFCLWLGIQLLSAGWTQGTVVHTLRALRPKLERAHREIMKEDSITLFSALRTTARPGDMAHPSTKPRFLIMSRPERVSDVAPVTPPPADIIDGERVYFEGVRSGKYFGLVTTLVELTFPAHRIAQALAETTPVKRGPSPR